MIERIVCVLALVLCTACANSPSPDTIVVNAKVFTANPAQPWAQAIAITGARIVAVGDSAAISAMAGPSTRRIDAGGRTIVPGFNDAHTHIAVTPPSARLPLPFDPTVDQIADAIRAHTTSTPPEQLIQGVYAVTAWSDRSFTRAWLDGLAPSHPVWLTAFTGHTAVLNSRALVLAGIDEQAPEVDGGVFERDATQRLSGRAVEYAKHLVDRRIALETHPDEIVRLYRQHAAEARTFGITSTQLLGESLPPAVASQALVASGTAMRWRYVRFPIGVGGETLDSRPVLPPQPSATIDVRGMKWILDGTPIERSAFLRAPYADSRDTSGRLSLSMQRIGQFVGWAYGSEDPLAVHAVGDGAIEAYLSAVERVGRAEVWRTKRPRLEHGDLLAPDLIPRVEALGIVVIQNPVHFMRAPMLNARLGPERMAWMQPMKSLLDAGIPIAIGSDGPMNPFFNIMAATTHPANPKEALTREQAVTAYTAGSAFAEFKEKDKGQIAVGMLADLAILSADVFTVPVEQMEAIRSVMTIFGGRVVHDNGAVH
jgi:predicted amidohydrolase YtcJ